MHDCCCFELFYRLELDFLQVSWFVGKVRNNLFLILYVATVETILSALLIMIDIEIRSGINMTFFNRHNRYVRVSNLKV